MWRRQDEVQTLLRDSAVAHLTQNHSPQRFRQCRVSEHGFDAMFWKTMAEAGWTGMLLPDAVGGSDSGLTAALTVAETLGEYLIPEPFVASGVIAASVLASLNGKRVNAIASQLSSGDAIVLLADQESADIVSPSLPSTTLTQKDGALVLSGEKAFVPSWTPEAHLLVTALLDQAVCVVLLEPGQEGIEVSRHRTTDGTFSANIVFRDFKISEDAIIARGPEATDAISRAILRGTIALSAQLEGLSRRLLKMTSEYVTQRTQFGHPISHFQALRHSLASLHIEIELAGAAWRSAAVVAEQGLFEISFAKISSAKARSSECALAVAKASIQFHGAFGYTEESDVGLFVNCALRWASWLGNASSHRGKALKMHQRAQSA